MNMIKYIKSKYSDIDILLTKKLKYIYFLNFFLNFFVNFLEIIGIGSIVIYISIIIDPLVYLSKYQENTLVHYLVNMNDYSRVILLSSILIGIFMFKGIFLFLATYIQNKFSFETNTYVSKKIFKSYLFKDYSFHLKNNPATLNQRIHNEVVQSTMYLDWSLKLINCIILILAILIILLVNSTAIGILNFLFILLGLILVRYFFKKRIEHRSKIRAKNDVEIFKTLQHAFGSFIETKLFKKESLFLNYYENFFRKKETQNMYLNILNSTPKILIELFMVIFIGIFFVTSYESNSKFVEILPLMTLVVVSFARLMPALSMLMMSLNQIKFLTYGKDTIVKELNEIKKYDEYIKSNGVKKTNISCNKNIKIENLSFKYEEDSNKYTFKNLNLKIDVGSKIAIVGESGAGKSTLINLLIGLLKPSSGKILVDGTSIFENIEKWHDIIGYIPQDIYLIDDTIEKNITFSKEDEHVDKDWLNKALKLSNIYEDIYKLKDGVQTLVGNRGVRFSGGQKQRIAIARAIYKKPKILIMDEPASGLDLENEIHLIENILSISKDITLIMISHNIDRHKGKFDVYKLENNSLIDE